MKPVKDMTDEELNREMYSRAGWMFIDGRYVKKGDPSNVVRASKLPDYSGDLNAMHEAELFMQKEDGSDIWLDYVDALRREARGWGGAGAEVSATARERAEAFVEVMRRKKS